MDFTFPTMDPSIKRVEASSVHLQRSPYMENPMKTAQIAQTPRLEEDHSISYFACIENGSKEVGSALFTLNPPSLSLYQFSDTSLYSYVNNLIELNRPTKILVPLSTTKSPLAQILVEQSRDNIVVEVPRSHFNDEKGNQMLLEYAHSPNEIFGAQYLTNRYLCLSAASAVLQYAQKEEDVDIFPHSLQTVFHSLEGHLMIDPLVLSNFNVLSAPKNVLLKISTSKRRICSPSLFNLIDRTLTPSGGRFLRSTLAAPPSDPRHITLRQEFVQELVMNDDMLVSLKQSIDHLYDIDDVITFLVTRISKKKSTTAKPLDCMIRLSKNGHILNGLKESLASMGSKLAQSLLKSLIDSKYDDLTSLIDEFIEPDLESKASFTTDSSSFIYCIKNGVVPLLDVTRKTYESTLQEIFRTTNEIAEKYGIQAQIKYNKSRRFYLQIRKASFQKRKPSSLASIANSVDSSSTTTSKVYHTQSGLNIPSEFIYIVETPLAIQATTHNLLLINMKNESAQNDTIALAQKYIESKVDDVRSFVSSIYAVSEIIGFVDCLLSFALVSKEYEHYTRPRVSSNILSLKGARHPILEQILISNIGESVGEILTGKKQKFIPNDISLSFAKRMTILSGVNMSGKSTLLQTVALNVILSHIGCFVPCTMCSIPILTSLFSRSGGSDSIEGNSSAFAVEMRELAHIATQADQNSLVLIDEPGSSTSPTDGASLAWSILEKLLEKKAFVIATTHFREIEMLPMLYSNVNICSMKAVVTEEGHYDYTYLLQNGECKEEAYGIRTAARYLPLDLIEYAQNAYNIVSKEHPKKGISTGREAWMAILQRLLTLKQSSLDDDGLRRYLIDLKNKCKTKKKKK